MWIARWQAGRGHSGDTVEGASTLGFAGNRHKGARVLGRQHYFLIFFGGVFALGVFGGADSVVAGERLALPFKCSIEGGNIRLVPAPEQSLAIVGARQERVVLACAEGRPVQCRTMIAHNFAVICGSERVSWVRLAESIGGRRTSRVWRDGEQLNISLRENDPEGATATATPCAPRSSLLLQSGSGSESDGAEDRLADEPCPKPNARELRFALPAGFAPVSHFGGRIVTEMAAAPAAKITEVSETRAPVLAAASRSETVSAEKKQRLLERTIVTETLPDLDVKSSSSQEVLRGSQGEMSLGAAVKGTTSAQPNGDAATRDALGAGASEMMKVKNKDSETPQRIGAVWSTTVSQTGSINKSDPDRTASFSAAIVDTTSTLQRDVMLWVLLTSLFVTAGWMAWSRPERFAGLTRWASRGALDGNLANAPLVRAASNIVSRAADSVTAVWPRGDKVGRSGGGFPALGLEITYDSVQSVVGSLSSELPIRGVLDDEMRRVRQRLALAKASSTDGQQLPAAAYRVLMRDLDRIRRIGESARDSVAARSRATEGAAGKGHMPRNRTEAFELLGLNANVSEATVKKCVDALRMSWHPDLAHDAADLVLREERIKQINVAMELISEKSQVN